MFILGINAEAQTSPQGITLEGNIVTAAGLPEESASVVFTVQIKSPGLEGCVLYQESQTLNMADSGGMFALTIGSGVRSGSGFEATSAIKTAFNNAQGLMTGLVCSMGSTYTPGSGDKRQILLTFSDGTGGIQTITQALDVESVPFALSADSLQGKLPGDFIAVNSATAALTQANLELIFNNGASVTKLQDLIAGTSGEYAKSTTAGGVSLPVYAGAPATPAQGAIWYDSSSGKLTFYDGTAPQALGTSGGSVTSVIAGTGLSGGTITTSGTISMPSVGTAGTYFKVTTDAQGRVTAGAALAAGDIPNLDAAKVTTGTFASGLIPSGTDSTKLPLAGGTMSGALKMGGNSIYGDSTASGNLSIESTLNATKGFVNINPNGGNVGIGTTSPAQVLEVNGNIALTQQGQRLIFGVSATDTSNSLYRDPSTGATRLTSASSIELWHSGDLAPKVFISTAGDVGIGTTTPGGRFEVQGGTAASGAGAPITIAGQAAAAGNNEGGHIVLLPGANTGSGSAGKVSVGAATPPTWMGPGLYVSDEIYSIGQVRSASLMQANGMYSPSFYGGFGVGGNLKIESTSDPMKGNISIAPNGGNVGIGTTSPSVALDLGSKTDALRLPNGTTAQQPGSPVTGLIRYNTNGGTPPGWVEFYNGSAWVNLVGSASAGNLNAVGNITGSGAMTISPGGTTQNLNLSNTTGGAVNVTTSAGNIMLQPGGAGSVTIPNATSSLGTTSGALVVGGGIGVAGAINAGGAIATSSTISAGTSLIAPALYGSALASQNLTLDSTSHATKGNVLIAPSGGNVGIGTTTPGAKLEINSHVTADAAAQVIINTALATNKGLVVQGVASQSANLQEWQKSDGTLLASVNSNGQFTGGLYNYPAQVGYDTNVSINAYSSWTDTYITSGIGSGTARNIILKPSGTGNVGIGTTSPTSLLHVKATSPDMRNEGTTASTLTMSTFNSGGNAPSVSLSHMGASGLPTDGLSLGEMNFFASTSGFVWKNTARITAIVNGTPSDTSLPTALAFHTAPTGTVAAVERVRIDQAGNVGIGTGTPLGLLNLAGSNQNVTLRVDNSASNANGQNPNLALINYSGGYNGSPYINLTQYRGSGSSPAAVQSGDLLAYIGAQGGSGSGYGLNEGARIVMKATETYSATNGGGSIGFYTAANGSTTDNLRMTVDQSGNVGIGMTVPGSKLEVAGDILVGNGNGISAKTSGGGTALLAKLETYDELTYGFNGANAMNFYLGGSQRVRILGNGNFGIGTTNPSEKLHVVGNLRVQGSTDCTLGNGAAGTMCSSDQRLKDHVTEIDRSLEKILSLRGVEFDWNEKSQSPGRHSIGVIAQDVEKAFPTAVVEDAGSGYKKVDYAVLVAPIIQAFKELHANIVNLLTASENHAREIASLKAQAAQEKTLKDKQIADLQNENLAIKARLEKIEKSLSAK